MMCLGFGGFKPILDGYTYAYMVVGDFDGRKPSFCARGGWGGLGKSKLQKCVSLFLMEDRYIVMIKVGKKVSWTKQLC